MNTLNAEFSGKSHQATEKQYGGESNKSLNSFPHGGKIEVSIVA